MDVIAERVMRSVQLSLVREHDPDLARTFWSAYSDDHSDAQHLIPSRSSAWWGSHEQVIFLQVLSALLSDSGAREHVPLREKYGSPSITVDLYSNHAVIPKALSYCPGPWSERTMKTITSNSGDDLSLVAACILVGAEWCRLNEARLMDVSERVHARMAARLSTWFSASASGIRLFPPSVEGLRKILMERFQPNRS